MNTRDINLIKIATLEAVVKKVTADRIEYQVWAEDEYCSKDDYIRYRSQAFAYDDLITFLKSDIDQLISEISESE